MHTQYEVKFLESVFDINDEFSSRLVYGSICSLQMELKGQVRVFLVYVRSRIINIMTWHGNLTYSF
jgi:hypothetical protein